MDADVIGVLVVLTAEGGGGGRGHVHGTRNGNKKNRSIYELTKLKTWIPTLEGEDAYEDAEEVNE